MDISVEIGKWLLGALQYIFQEKILTLYNEIMQFLSAFIVTEYSLDSFPFIHQLTNYMAAVVNALLILIILWYAAKKMFVYAGFEADNPLMFFSKLIFYAVLANSGFYLTKYIIWVFSSVIHAAASFSPTLDLNNLKGIFLSFTPAETTTLFSAHGIFLLITMIYVIKLCFTFSVRFILITLVLTPLSPLAIISNMSQAMSGIFKGWLKLLMTLMTSQLVQMLLIIGIVSIRAYSGPDLPRLQVDFYTLCVFWLMSRIDIYVKDIIAGIGVYQNLSSGLDGIRNSISSVQQDRSIIIKK